MRVEQLIGFSCLNVPRLSDALVSALSRDTASSRSAYPPSNSCLDFAGAETIWGRLTFAPVTTTKIRALAPGALDV